MAFITIQSRSLSIGDFGSRISDVSWAACCISRMLGRKGSVSRMIRQISV